MHLFIEFHAQPDLVPRKHTEIDATFAEPFLGASPAVLRTRRSEVVDVWSDGRTAGRPNEAPGELGKDFGRRRPNSVEGLESSIMGMRSGLDLVEHPSRRIGARHRPPWHESVRDDGVDVRRRDDG